MLHTPKTDWYCGLCIQTEKKLQLTANIMNYKILWLIAIVNKWLSYVILKIIALISCCDETYTQYEDRQYYRECMFHYDMSFKTKIPLPNGYIEHNILTF